MVGDNEKDHKGPISANWNINCDNICTKINQFEKALVQIKERVKLGWKGYEKFVEHNKLYKDSTSGKKF